MRRPRGSWPLYAQYFNIIHMGKDGYTDVMNECQSNAEKFAALLTESGRFEVLSDLQLPIVAFRFKEDVPFTERHYAHRMK